MSCSNEAPRTIEELCFEARICLDMDEFEETKRLFDEVKARGESVDRSFLEASALSVVVACELQDEEAGLLELGALLDREESWDLDSMAELYWESCRRGFDRVADRIEEWAKSQPQSFATLLARTKDPSLGVIIIETYREVQGCYGY